MTDYAALAEAGLFGRDRAVASITDRLGMPGSGDPARVLHARVAGGFDFEVLPGRGFDIGDTYLHGAPLSWFSPVADSRPLDVPRGRSWLERFTGGLLSTCGLDHIGPPTDTVGLHGSAGHRPASDIAFRIRRHGADGTAPLELPVELTGAVDAVHMFGPSLRMERTITSGVDGNGTAHLRVVDVVINSGCVTAPVAVLYHLNLGAPLVVPGSTVHVGGPRPSLREACPFVPDAGVLPEPCTETTEAVFEYPTVPVDAEGFSRAVVTSPSGTTSLQISWSAATLPRLYQWVFPTRARWALAIEPATAPLFGPDRDLPYCGSPVLEPGEHRRHEIRFAVPAADITNAVSTT